MAQQERPLVYKVVCFLGALRIGQPLIVLDGHHVEAADEQMSQLLQLPCNWILQSSSCVRRCAMYESLDFCIWCVDIHELWRRRARS